MEAVRDYELKALFTHAVQALERIDIPYMVVGGFAAIFYGEPRLTIDVDIIVDMNLAHIAPFVASFPLPDYYVSQEGVRDSIERCYPFNVIHPSTGAKIDLVPMRREDLLVRVAFQHRQRLDYDQAGHSAMFITPEDIIVAKLAAFRATRSEKHLNDARGVLIIQWDKLDMVSIDQGARSIGMRDQLEKLIQEISQENQA
jgi:hypothetical protein